VCCTVGVCSTHCIAPGRAACVGSCRANFPRSEGAHVRRETGHTHKHTTRTTRTGLAQASGREACVGSCRAKCPRSENGCVLTLTLNLGVNRSSALTLTLNPGVHPSSASGFRVRVNTVIPSSRSGGVGRVVSCKMSQI